MKKIIFYIKQIFFIALISIVGCESDSTNPLPDGMKDGCFAYIDLDVDGSSPYVDILNPNDYILKGNVEVLYTPKYQKLTLLVVYNNDFSVQYVVKDNITSTPTAFSLSLQNIVDVITSLTGISDIKEGDSFLFFVNATLTDGTVLRTYDSEGTRLINSDILSTLKILNGVTSFNTSVSVPCAFVYADFLGAYNCVELWPSDGPYTYPVTIEEDPDVVPTATQKGIIILGLFDGTGVSKLKAVLDIRKLTVSSSAKQVVIADVTTIGYPASYGSLYASATSGQINTCDHQFKLSIGWTVDAGSFGTATHTLTKVSTPE